MSGIASDRSHPRSRPVSPGTGSLSNGEGGIPEARTTGWFGSSEIAGGRSLGQGIPTGGPGGGKSSRSASRMAVSSGDSTPLVASSFVARNRSSHRTHWVALGGPGARVCTLPDFAGVFGRGFALTDVLVVAALRSNLACAAETQGQPRQTGAHFVCMKHLLSRLAKKVKLPAARPARSHLLGRTPPSGLLG